jgi:hypothetical protein
MLSMSLVVLGGDSQLWSTSNEDIVFRREIDFADVGCEGDGINVPAVAMTMMTQVE